MDFSRGSSIASKIWFGRALVGFFLAGLETPLIKKWGLLPFLSQSSFSGVARDWLAGRVTLTLPANP